MDRGFIKALAIFIIIAFGAWYARHTGWYNEYWYTDIILHLLSGTMFAYLWLWLSTKEIHNSRWLVVLNCVAFAALGSVLWEFWEFAGWRITPSHTQFYIPTLSDSLGDILCGMIGTLVISLHYILRTYSRKA